MNGFTYNCTSHTSCMETAKSRHGFDFNSFFCKYENVAKNNDLLSYYKGFEEIPIEKILN